MKLFGLNKQKSILVFYVCLGIFGIISVSGQGDENQVVVTAADDDVTYDDDEYSMAKCIPCDNEFDIPNEFADIEGITCGEWNTVYKLQLANSESCTRQRFIGQKYCQCAKPDEKPADPCRCPPDRPRPRVNTKLAGTQLSCDQAAYLPAIDGDKSCKMVADSCCAAPSTTDKTCTLCKVKDNMPKQMNLIIIGRSDGKTCGDLGGKLVLGPDDCHGFNFNHTIDEAAYCECPGITPRRTCSLCPYGQGIVDPDRIVTDVSGTVWEGVPKQVTCGDFADIALYVSSRTACAKLKVKANNGCCGVVTPGTAPTVGMETTADQGGNGGGGNQGKSGAVLAAMTSTITTTATIALMLPFTMMVLLGN